MASGGSLRAWQRAALAQLEAKGQRDFLAVATPGAGKTTFALTAARRALLTRRALRLVVVAPTRHLKLQWANAAEDFGLHLEPEWSTREGELPGDVHGVAVTYQQVASSPRTLRSLTRNSFAVFDEIHHAGDARAWGDALRLAFEEARCRLSLSGTPFRSDDSTIPFVEYAGDEAKPDFEYGYGEALRDRRVVRPVYFPRVGGEMEWRARDGELHSHTFDDVLDPGRTGQRLRTALSSEGEWLPAVLERAHEQLRKLRKDDPRAGALAIAMDQDHARAIGRSLRERLGVRASVVTSDDPSASRRISEYAVSSDPWIVAVRMVSEGVDIPRLRVGVFATNTTTDLFFRQAVGRLVRWVPELGRQNAYMFIPDDPRLRGWAFDVRKQRRHSLKPKPDAGAEWGDEEREESGRDAAEEQLGLFAPISAVAHDTSEPAEESPWDDEESEALEAAFALEAGGGGTEDRDFVPLPAPAGPQSAPGELARSGAPAGSSIRQRKKTLRSLNTERARVLAQLTGSDYASVNGELNRLAGIRRVTEATAGQLERRLNAANGWLRRLRARGQQRPQA
ncbi:MAG: DEAD/DEAH box helicase [Deltaproteobacteria bacterium]|nr:DEAD/DEAH box helicase [Deltaproteobacteria bacterium]